MMGDASMADRRRGMPGYVFAAEHVPIFAVLCVGLIERNI